MLKARKKSILFFTVFFLSSLTLFRRIFTLVVLNLSELKSLFELISDLNGVLS